MGNLIRTTVGAMAVVAAALVMTPAAQADPKTCDSGEVCLYMENQVAIYTTAGNVDDYASTYWTDRGSEIFYRFTKLNDLVRTAYNSGCQCGPTVVAFYRDNFGGGGAISKIGLGGSTTMPIKSDAGASSHRWVWS